MDKEKAAELAERTHDLLQATNKKKPKPEDLAALEKCFDDYPALWHVASLAHTAAIRTIESVQATEGTRVVFKANYEGMRASLGYDKATTLERPLIEHVALCWLRLQLVEQKYSSVTAESITLTLADFWERRLSAAQRRYLRACETLARVRRLRLPALQVNIGQEQTNIAGTLAPGGQGKAAR